MNKLTAITVFRKVIEQGSFKAAAEDLGLSKAAVSKNIKQLEDTLKTPLIHRTTRTMSITDSGQIYYKYVCRVLDELTLADHTVLQAADTLQGTLKLSIPMSMGALHINAAICQFMDLYPELTVEVVMSDDYVDLVDYGFDIAVRGSMALQDSSLKSRQLLKLNRVLCASPCYLDQNKKLKTPEDLIAHNCLTYNPSKSSRRWVFSSISESYGSNEDETLNTHLTIDLAPASYTVNNAMALKQAALANVGIILIPEMFVACEISSGALIKLLPKWQTASLELYALYPYHQEQSYKLRMFLDFLIDYLSQKN